MKIVILTQWYPPEPAALQRELAETLQASGHEITVLTGFPNYPSGKIYPEYRLRPFQREMLDGIRVVRVPLYPEHSRSGLRRALNYLSFAFSCALLGPFLLKRPDTLFVYHPPLTVGFPAFVLSRLWRVPFVYQIQDIWPETLKATGMLKNGRILYVVGRFAEWVYRKADAICVISPGFKKNLMDKGVPKEKIHVISNWVDTGFFSRREPNQDFMNDLGLSGRFIVMYAGNIGEAQGLEVVLDAADLLRDMTSLQFVLVGDGTALPGLEREARSRGLANVRFLGRFPPDRMPCLYSLADVLFIHLKDEDLFRITIPHKTLAYMSVGRPILAAVVGDAADVVLEAGAGLTCSPGDPRALAETVRRFRAMSASERLAMGRRGEKAALTRYDRHRPIGEIEAVLRSSISRTSR
ncbi:glycosyltransferase family 4 protein [Gemmatimonadota bacterium]